MKKLVFLIPLFLLASCDPAKCPLSNNNSSEATLQSAEDAMKKDFDENSFINK